MPKTPRKLSEVMKTSPVPEGFNDGRWFLLEHQLYQFRLSVQQVNELAIQIASRPENPEECELAWAISEMVSPLCTESLGVLARIKSLLAGTEVAERIGKKEE